MAPTSWFGKFLSCFASELNRLDNSILNLLTNAVPGLSIDLLPEWEYQLGLPEPGYPLNQTLAQRQVAAHSKYTVHYSGLSEQFFIDLALSLGEIITISDGAGAGLPFRADGPLAVDITRVGPTSPASLPDSRVWGVAQLHVWVVNIASSAQNLELIRAVFEKMKPAHTIVQFNLI